MRDLSLRDWDSMSLGDRTAVADGLSRELPGGFQFSRLETHRLGGAQRQVAVFASGERRFALVPGGETTLGFDAASWVPEPAEEESWRDTAEEFALPGTIREHVAAVTGRPRSVRVAPCLVETEAHELGWHPVPAGDEDVRRLAQEHLQPATRFRTLTVQRPDAAFRLTRERDGRVTAHRFDDRKHALLAAEVAAGGFRFPTSDEWEHACGAGASSLFRWGDHAPADRYPTDVSEWDLHRRPNGFGLLIASNPYHGELVQEPDVVRGGDGGAMICGGAGFFIAWLTLATSYFEADFSRRDPEQPLTAGFAIGRRVLPLA